MQISEEPEKVTRCILPSSYPNIDFDEKGEYRVCREIDAKIHLALN